MAQELGKFAETEGRGDQFHMAVFKAYFANGVNIGLENNLIDLGLAAGLPENKVRDVLENRTYKSAVDDDWNRSYQMGVTAVPTFVMNGMSLVGAQPYDKLTQLVETAGAEVRI